MYARMFIFTFIFFGCQKARITVEANKGVGHASSHSIGAGGGSVTESGATVIVSAGTIANASNAILTVSSATIDSTIYAVDHLASNAVQVGFSSNDSVLDPKFILQPYTVTLASTFDFDPAKLLVLVIDPASKQLITTIADPKLLTIATLADGTKTVSFTSQFPSAIFVLATTSASTTSITATTSGVPSGTSSSISLSVTVGGTGVVSYFYKIGATATTNCSVASGYSSTAALVAQKISDNISTLSDGSITLCVVGKNAAGSIQSYSSASSSTWTKSTPALSSVSSLSISHSTGNVYLSWPAATPTPTGYVVIRRSGSAVSWTPVNSSTYAAGFTPDGGTNTVMYVGSSTSFTDSAVANGTTYYYSVYAYNSIHAYQTTSASNYTQPTGGGLWTLAFGSNALSVAANFGTMNVVAGSNTPGGTSSFPFWYVDDTHVYLGGSKSDLWRWDGSNWVWIYGSNSATAPNWGTIKVAAASNTPGNRNQACTFVDSAHNLWLFGGYTPAGVNADVWKFDGTGWIWMKGPNSANTAGTYGSMGIANPANNPPARGGSACWIDSSDRLWIFGGRDIGAAGFGDLWMFDGTDWTWKSGSSSTSSVANYGTLGVPSPTNDPGNRDYPSGNVVDSLGNLWLFGGIDQFGSSQNNDLWKYDGSNWTWMSGSNGFNQFDLTTGTPHPGARFAAASAIDKTRNIIYIAGGRGCDSSSCVAGWSDNTLSDLWSYDINSSTWTSLRTAPKQSPGNYGTINVTNPANFPAGRGYLPSWFDSHGDFWIVGGYTQSGNLSDIWRYSP